MSMNAAPVRGTSCIIAAYAGSTLGIFDPILLWVSVGPPRNYPSQTPASPPQSGRSSKQPP